MGSVVTLTSNTMFGFIVDRKQLLNFHHLAGCRVYRDFAVSEVFLNLDSEDNFVPMKS